MVMKHYMLHRPLADMESDGVYFPEFAKQQLIDDREKEVCQYSGLPSVMTYVDDRIREKTPNLSPILTP
jgi:hypothetical protein